MLIIKDGNKTSWTDAKTWHIGEDFCVAGRVVNFQADGDELEMIINAMNATHAANMRKDERREVRPSAATRRAAWFAARAASRAECAAITDRMLAPGTRQAITDRMLASRDNAFNTPNAGPVGNSASFNRKIELDDAIARRTADEPSDQGDEDDEIRLQRLEDRAAEVTYDDVLRAKIDAFEADRRARIAAFDARGDGACRAINEQAQLTRGLDRTTRNVRCANCNHSAMVHAGSCHAGGCKCRSYRALVDDMPGAFGGPGMAVSGE